MDNGSNLLTDSPSLKQKPAKHKENRVLTLSSDQNDGYFGGISVVRQFRVIRIDCIEARFVLQAEHKYYGIDPSGELPKNIIFLLESLRKIILP